MQQTTNVADMFDEVFEDIHLPKVEVNYSNYNQMVESTNELYNEYAKRFKSSYVKSKAN